MGYLGELISLGVAFSWTIAALSSEIGSKRLGVFVMNVWRMGVTLLLSALLMWLTLGQPYPVYAGGLTRSLGNTVGKERMPTVGITAFQHVLHDARLFIFVEKGYHLHDVKVERVADVRHRRPFYIK